MTRTPRLSDIARIALVAIVLACPHAALAQQPDPDDARKAKDIETQAVLAFHRGELDTAATLFELQRQLTPRSFIVHFNLACTRSLLGEVDEAEDRIARAIELGFDDVHTLRLDPALAPLRKGELYSDLLDNWPRILEARRQSIVTRDKGWTRGRYTDRTDDALRIEIRSAYSEEATDLALADLQAVAAFLTDTLFTELPNEPWHSHTPWVSVVLPNERDYAAWAEHAVGGAARGLASVGGAYDDHTKRLVAQDLGATLWHEFAHALHYRDAARNHQTHALWIVEGIGALVETFDTNPDGSITPASDWRLNSLKRARERALLNPITDLAATTHEDFNGPATLRTYAHARAVMLYLHQKNQLDDFYTNYTKSLTSDPSGLTALEATTGFTPDLFDDALNAWLDTLPMVPETFEEAGAAIACELAPSDGDGPKVSGFGEATKGPDALKLGSVITHVNGHPTRDLRELARTLAKHAPGDTVTLTARRGRLVSQIETTLVEPE
ncbi:MAG: TPR end-of-group domain-containing protein [Phycisphaerales bacterium JB040]